jgi:hypothetical protein
LRPVIAPAGVQDLNRPINLRPSDYKPRFLNDSQRQISVAMITENESTGTYTSNQHYFYQIAADEERKRSVHSHFNDRAQNQISRM